MKIERVETIRYAEFPNLVYVELHADGLSGLGESYYASAAVEAHIHDVCAPLLLGEDAGRTAALNAKLDGYVGYAGSGAETRARSAIDIALWDLKAKAAGVPLYELMGGRTRETIRAYNTCAGTHYIRRNGQSTSNWGLDTGPGALEDLDRFLIDAGGLAEDLLAEGIDAMKIWPFDPYAERSRGTGISNRELELALTPIRKIREAVGDEMDVMIELHALWNVSTANRIVQALAPYRPLWIEDPVRPDVVGGLAEVRATAARAGTMVAAGETVAGTTGFLPLFANRSLDVVTLDVGWCGGLTKAVQIAALADAYGLPIAPHDCTGPVALLVATHLAVSAPNAMIQETVRASLRTWYGNLVTALPTVVDGQIAPPDACGHGAVLHPELRSREETLVRASDASTSTAR